MKNLKILLVVIVLIGISATLTNQILMKPFINSSSEAVTANSTDINKLSGLATTKTELGYLNGTTSAVQTQLNGKVNTSDVTSALTVFYTKTQVDSVAALKTAKAGDTFTGPVYVPTAAAGTNTTQAASTAFVHINTARQIFPIQGQSYSFPYANTGNTTENTILTFTIPASSIGINGSFHIIFRGSATSNTNTKSLRIKFNGTTVAQGTFTSTSCYGNWYQIFTNRNSLSANVWGANVDSGQQFTKGTAAFVTGTIATASDITVTVTLQCNTSGTDTISLESLQIIAYY